MLIAIVTFVHLIAGNLFANSLAYKFPNVRMDTLLCILLGVYGCITSSLPLFYSDLGKTHPVTAHSVAISWFIITMIAMFELIFNSCRLLAFRKRLTLVPGHSYLYGGLFVNRSKMIVSSRGGFFEKVKSEYFEYYSKYGFTPYSNYDEIIKDARIAFDCHHAFMQELTTRKAIQDYAHNNIEDYEWG